MTSVMYDIAEVVLVKTAVEIKKEDYVMNEIPIWEKCNLTIPQAAAYFNIGQNRLRSWIRDNVDSGCLLWVGSKALIKREQFEDYLHDVNVL